MPAKASIYILIDPRDGTIRYVGKTTKSLPERLAGHLASPTNPAMRLWISTLSAQRLVPIITQVSAVPETRLDAEEQRLIRKHAREGHRLFNGPYYAQHLGDLTAPPETPGPLPGAAAPRRRGVRYFIYTVVLGAYLWTVGFDVLIRREVLPRLPLAEVSLFWHTYLARPLLLIFLHGLAVLAVWSLSLYMQRRRHTKPKNEDPSERVDPDFLADAAARALVGALEKERP